MPEKPPFGASTVSKETDSKEEVPRAEKEPKTAGGMFERYIDHLLEDQNRFFKAQNECREEGKESLEIDRDLEQIRQQVNAFYKVQLLVNQSIWEIGVKDGGKNAFANKLDWVKWGIMESVHFTRESHMRTEEFETDSQALFVIATYLNTIKQY